MTTSGATPFRLTERCPVCTRPIGPKHRETCPGPSQRIAPPPVREETCGCPDGMFHRPLCPLVTGKDAA